MATVSAEWCSGECNTRSIQRVHEWLECVYKDSLESRQVVPVADKAGASYRKLFQSVRDVEMWRRPR